MKSFFNSLYTITKSPKKLKATPDAVDPAICFYPTKPENADENQPIANLKPRTFANTTVTGKKVSFHQNIAFLLKFIWCKRNDRTTNKLSIFLSVADFANNAIIVFTWPAWVVYGFAIATKGSKPQPSATVVWLIARLGRKTSSFPQFWTANIQMLSKNCYDRVKSMIRSTKL